MGGACCDGGELGGSGFALEAVTRAEVDDDDESQLKLSIKNINYKINGAPKRRKIVETPHGFTTLSKKLPFWIETQLKKQKNKANTIDK